MSAAPKTPEQLLATASQLPPEMDLARIELIVTDFSAGGPAPADAFPVPKILSLTGLVATAGLLVFYLSGPGPVPAAVDVRAPEPEAEVLTAVSPELPSPAPQEPVVAPAPPAPAPTIRQGILTVPACRSCADGIQRKIAALTATPPAAQPFGPTLISGNWRWTGTPGSGIRLDYEERVNGRRVTWQLFPGFSEEELTDIFSDTGRAHLERETGRLILFGKNGEFSFQPRTALRDRYESKGWGTAAATAEDVQLNGTLNGKLIGADVVTNNPADILWLRYFTADVGEAYFAKLSELGVRRNGLQRTWELVNHGIELDNLRSLTADILHTKFPPGELTIDLLLDMHENADLLHTLSNFDYSLTAGTWRLLRDTRLTPQYLQEVHATPAAPYRWHDLLAVYRAGIPAAPARELLSNTYDGTTIEQLIEAYEPPTSELRKSKIHLSFGDDGSARTRTRVKSLPDFHKLIVTDGFKVIVVPGDSNRAVITLAHDNFIDVAFSVDKRGTLQIHERVPFVNWVTGIPNAEIRLEVTDLERVHARSRAEVIVAPEVGIEKWSVYGKGEVRVEAVEDDH